MEAISTDYASIGLVSTSSTAAATQSGDQDFSAVLAAQLVEESQTTSQSDSASEADLALTSYSSGQQVASAASAATASTEEASATAAAGETGTASDQTSASDSTTTTAAATTTAETEETASAEETSSEETAETEETAQARTDGWPADALAEWTPSNMQFFDELSGTWVDDNIPHRVNSDGQLEYYWEGEWYLDTAVRHRVATNSESGESTEGEATASAYSLEGEGPYTSEEYYNTALSEWVLFNFPYRENEDGSREYYWADQWWEDSFDHRSA